MDSLVGRTLGHYRLTSLLGRGGMGEVYRAEDTELGREVAVKVLPPEVAGDPQRLSRFRREARAVAALNHPSIVTIHSVEEVDGIHFLTLELVDGAPLSERIPEGGMGPAAFFAVATQLTRALAAAHARGIVHRDVKPSNVMVSDVGDVKVLDFGLAQVVREEIAETAPTATVTQVGSVLGTPGYMSPEQACGRPADARSDVFSTGVVLYEMLTGHNPFRRADGPSTIHAILHDPVAPPAGPATAVPGLAGIVERCLSKDATLRFPSAVELSDTLAHCRLEFERKHSTVGWRRSLAALASIAIVLAGAGGWWLWTQFSARRAVDAAIPRIEEAIEAGDHYAAFIEARSALARVPDDPWLLRQFERVTFPLDATTRPEGATVTFRHYVEPDGPWWNLGTTPLTGARLPTDYLALRLERDGYESQTFAFWGFSLDRELIPEGMAPAGMVRVPGGVVSVGSQRPELPAFWIDRYEVTNAEFQAFVDAGGYADASYWQEALVDRGRTLTRAEAMERFVDATGRPGPAGWELGRFPDGRDRHPVGGVSWYEAAAYARWADKSLPTVFHWKRAAGSEVFSDILLLSNFGGEGTAAVGEHRGLGVFGTYDMAGNVKEWCLNATGSKRYTLGGGWNESQYTFADADAREPFDREASFGLRLVRLDAPPPESLTGSLVDTRFDFGDVEPVSDEVYAFFERLYAYEPRDLDARLERVDEKARYWRRETVSVEPAYAGTRLLIHLFLPIGGSPPYQAVVDRPNSFINVLDRIEDYPDLADYIPRSGRVLVVPAYWATLERREATASPRERIVRQVQDLRRAIDYLQTRDDIDPEQIAYIGMSAGGEYAPVYLANEPRIKAAVVVGAGFHDAHMLTEPPETNPWNFAPRVRIPVLMINGENDFTLPRTTAQEPYFELLGTPPEHKRLVAISGGHVTADAHARVRETLSWLDHYLGPVEP